MVISLLLLSNLALAQDFQNLSQGQVAPFTGTLITPDGMAKIITIEDAKLSECEELSRHQIEVLTISNDAQVEKLKFDLKKQKESSDKIIEEKDKELDRIYQLVKKQNKNLTPMWIGIGFAAGLTTSIGTYYVYNNI
jgi:hypothetical protein